MCACVYAAASSAARPYARATHVCATTGSRYVFVCFDDGSAGGDGSADRNNDDIGLLEFAAV